MRPPGERAARAPFQLRAVGIGFRAGPRTLLHPATLAFSAGSLVGVVGPSGAGKSVLLTLLAGRCRPGEGYVELGGEPLDASPAVAARVGFVPQANVLFENLTPAEHLAFAAALRPGVPRPQAADVVRQLGLEPCVGVPVRHLSGGERKRVHVGMELLHDPSVLVLDEPTAGLDPAAEEWMMRFLRALADRGRLVLMSTHAVRTLRFFDRVNVLFQGRVVYAGTVEALPPFFGIGGVEALSDALPSQSGLEWELEFKSLRPESPAPDGRSGRWEAAPRAAAGSVRPGSASRGGSSSYPTLYCTSQNRQDAKELRRSPRTAIESSSWRSLPAILGDLAVKIRGNSRGGFAFRGLRHFFELARRYGICLTRDRWLLSVLLAQAPLIGLFLVLAYRAESPANDLQLLIKLALAAVWFGCINACRELVKERPIYVRERFAGLGLAPYLASKLAVLVLLGLVQVLLLLGTVRMFRFVRGDFTDLAAALAATTTVSLLLGLAVSSVVRNSDQALGLVPVAVIPQAILVGVAAPLEGFAGALEKGMISTWSFRLLRDLTEGAPCAADAVPLGAIGLVLLGMTVAGLKALDRRTEVRT